MTVIAAFLILLVSCNSNENGETHDLSSIPLQDNQTSWTLVADSSGLPKPLSLFLQLRSDTIVLKRITELGSDKNFFQCQLSFQAIRPVNLKSLREELEKARNSIPTRSETLTEENNQQILLNYALLEIQLLDSSGQIIEDQTMLSTKIDSLKNLATGNGNISFEFQKEINDENSKRVIVSNPGYFRVRLSDTGTGLSKVFSDYIMATEK